MVNVIHEPRRLRPAAQQIAHRIASTPRPPSRLSSARIQLSEGRPIEQVIAIMMDARGAPRHISMASRALAQSTTASNPLQRLRLLTDRTSRHAPKEAETA
jgi:hypothetical protein